MIPDIEGFELELCSYLEMRAARKPRQFTQTPTAGEVHSPKPISWIGSLFAILASGTQYSDSSFQERKKKSQLYSEWKPCQGQKEERTFIDQ